MTQFITSEKLLPNQTNGTVFEMKFYHKRFEQVFLSKISGETKVQQCQIINTRFKLCSVCEFYVQIVSLRTERSLASLILTRENRF